MKDSTVYTFNVWDFIHEGYKGEHTGQWSVASIVYDWSALKEHRYYITIYGLHLGLGPFSLAMTINAMMA